MLTNRLAFAFGVFAFASALSAQTVETIPFRAVLSARNETTPVVDNTATGAANIFLHVVRDGSGKIVSGSVDFTVSYKFAGAVSLTAMHIHKAPAGVAGPIVVPVAFTRTDDPTGVGSVPLKQTNVASTDTPSTGYDAVVGILQDPSQFYFNIHSTDAPGGAMRGQLQRADQAVLVGLMSPANETPAITSPGTAVGSIIAYRTADAAGNPTSGFVIFDVNYTGFPSDTNFTGLHLHFGNAGTAGPVTINTGLRGPFPGAASGSGNLHFEVEVDLTANLAAATLNALFVDPSQVYINVHTSVFAGGAARDQLRKTDATTLQLTLNTSEETPAPGALQASAPSAVTFYSVRNLDGSVPAGVVQFDVNPRFPAGTTFTAMHIHDAALGVAGPVTIDSRLSAFPIATTDGTGNLNRFATVSTGAAVASMNDVLVSPEKHYLNLHTTANAAGAVRAQLAPNAGPNPVVGAAISSVSDISRRTAAPGALMTIFGSNLSRLKGNLDGFRGLDTLPKSLNGTSVTIGGAAASLLLVAPQQIVLQVPAEATAGNQPLVVTSSTGASAALSVPVTATAPNIFFDAAGGLIVRNNDFQLVRGSNAAAAGDILVIYSTGSGATSAALPTGKLAGVSPLSSVSGTTAVTVGGVPATVLYSIAAPGFAGLNQTAIRMPSGVPAGTAQVVMTVGGVTSNSVALATR